MKRKVELLAPGGDIDSIKAAILAGADAVYCGLIHFNARNRATNIELDELSGILRLAHKNDCKIFLALNITIVESEFRTLIKLINKLVNTTIDGVIVQDLGLFYLLSNYFKSLEVHASTQCTTHNAGQICFLSKLGVTRVNLSRELSVDEISSLSLAGHRNNVLTEVFVHGSYCISFSGICYFSSVHGGRSGNRGRCSQPCRDKYLPTPEKKELPLNLKDNSAYLDLGKLVDAGVSSLKIEGRIKKFHYVHTVVNYWRNQIDRYYNTGTVGRDNSELYTVFNRDFTNSYLKGEINRDMFIDNSRDHSIGVCSDAGSNFLNSEMTNSQMELYEISAEIITHVKQGIEQLSTAKIPIAISISGKLNTPLTISINTPDESFDVLSETNLVTARKNKLDHDILVKRIGALNSTEYHVHHLESEGLQSDLFIPFKELTSLRTKIISLLNGTRELIDPVEVPLPKREHTPIEKTGLAVLISSQDDLHICNDTSVDVFYQLPNCLGTKYQKFVDIFTEHSSLIPWFPSILIGEHYAAAVNFLQQVQPKRIVTNNTGIAHDSYKMEIPWIAGPYLNIVNSFSLSCIRDNFNCFGAFISNEISKYQIRRIANPGGIKLYYSLYHPILLLTSRQCLFHQVIGCEKDSIDERCVSECNNSSSITNLKGVPLLIKKEKGSYHCIYNNHNFLNTEIVADLPGIFSNYLIDLRNIETKTKIELSKPEVVELFHNLLAGIPDSQDKLKQSIYPSTDSQYVKGI